MPSQSARILVLLCVVMGLMGSSGLAPGYAAEDREILEHITGQTHHDERLEGTEVHIVVRGGHVVLSGTVYLYSQKMLYEHIAGRTRVALVESAGLDAVCPGTPNRPEPP